MSAATLYLHLRGQGLRLTVVRRPDHVDGSGYALRVAGLLELPEPEQGRYQRLIVAHKPGLLALLQSGSPDALAVRAEGHDGSDKRSRKAA